MIFRAAFRHDGFPGAVALEMRFAAANQDEDYVIRKTGEAPFGVQKQGRDSAHQGHSRFSGGNFWFALFGSVEFRGARRPNGQKLGGRPKTIHGRAREWAFAPHWHLAVGKNFGLELPHDRRFNRSPQRHSGT
jgi:hypothetical protein